MYLRINNLIEHLCTLGGHGIQLAGLQAAVQVGQQQHSTGVQRLVAAPTRPSPHTIVQLVQTTAGSNPAGVQLVSHAGTVGL